MIGGDVRGGTYLSTIILNEKLVESRPSLIEPVILKERPA